MEQESVASAKTSERPVTRWRRDQDGLTDSSKTQRPLTGVSSSKFERPSSRRGSKNESPASYGISGGHPATPGWNAVGRLPSASILANRVPTAGSRLPTTSSNNFGRLGTGLSSSGQMNMSILERPITQQGIAGVRPGSTRGLPMTRQILDKRYYVGLMQLKIRELTQEINNMIKDIDNQNKERATFLHYDKRVKDLATELTSLQGQLADYNLVVDKMTSNVGKEYIDSEREELALKNERTMMEIERMFDERKLAEQQLSKMEKQLENEKKRTERLIESMDPSIKQEYENLLKEKAELQEKANRLQQEIDELSKEAATFEEEIALSPLKQEAVKLHLKIIEAEEKKEKLREEERTRLSPEAEKEKLLQKIKQDNMDIAAAEAQLAEKKKRIEEAEQELEQLETDIEGTQSEKQMKYKELRKREEVMEQFMSVFPQNKQEETQKLEKLEQTIVGHLEAISNISDTDVDFTVADEMAVLHSAPPYDDYKLPNHALSFEGLTEEHLKLHRVLKKMEMLEERLKEEVNELNAKTVKGGGRNSFDRKSEKKQEELVTECKMLKNQQSLHKQKRGTVQAEHDELKERLSSNETYVQINEFDDKLDKLKEDRKKIEDFIAEQKEETDFGSLKERTSSLVNTYSKMLKDNLKLVY